MVNDPPLDEPDSPDPGGSDERMEKPDGWEDKLWLEAPGGSLDGLAELLQGDRARALGWPPSAGERKARWTKTVVPRTLADRTRSASSQIPHRIHQRLAEPLQSVAVELVRELPELDFASLIEQGIAAASEDTRGARLPASHSLCSLLQGIAWLVTAARKALQGAVGQVIEAVIGRATQRLKAALQTEARTARRSAAPAANVHQTGEEFVTNVLARLATHIAVAKIDLALLWLRILTVLVCPNPEKCAAAEVAASALMGETLAMYSELLAKGLAHGTSPRGDSDAIGG